MSPTRRLKPQVEINETFMAHRLKRQLIAAGPLRYGPDVAKVAVLQALGGVGAWTTFL